MQPEFFWGMHLVYNPKTFFKYLGGWTANVPPPCDTPRMKDELSSETGGKSVEVALSRLTGQYHLVIASQGAPVSLSANEIGGEGRGEVVLNFHTQSFESRIRVNPTKSNL
jgi:hypothetical protein